MFDLGEFGDGNPYTVVSEDLKSPLSAPPAGAWSGFALMGSGLPPITDPVLGTKFVDANGDEAGYRFSGMLSALDQTHYEGHVKIKGSRGWFCGPEANNNGNQGDTLSSAQKLISSLAAAAPGGTAVGLLSRSVTTSMSVLMPGAAGVVAVRKDFRSHIIGSDAQAVLHTAGKPEQVDIDILWKGRYGFVAVDGLVVNATADRQHAGWTDIWNNFYLGSDRGIAGTFCSGHWFSDFEIRTKCPEFSLNYPYRRIGVLSDSLFDDLPVSANAAGDVSARYRIQRKFNKRGQYVNINISENGGYRVTDQGANWLGDPAIIATALENNPVEVLVSAGTNDAIFGADIADGDFQSAAMDILEKLLGENGNPATGVETVKWLIPIPLWGARGSADYDTFVARAARYRAILKNLPALWDAAYPSRQGAVRALDSFEALGGESNILGDDLYVGDTTGSLTDLHLVGHGMQIWGDFIAQDY